MAILIRPARLADADAVCRLLHEKMNRKISPERWRRVLDYPWWPKPPDRGFLAEDAGRVVGYMGRVHSTRMISGREEHFTSATAWYLEQDYRGQGIGFELLKRVTAEPDWTHNFFSSSARTLELLKGVGLVTLDSQRFIWRRDGQARPGVDIVEHPKVARHLLDAGLRKLLDDQAPYGVVPILLRARGEQSLLMFSVVKKGRNIRYFDLVFASQPALLAAHAQDLANLLLPPGPAILAVDCRFLRGFDIAAETEQFEVPRFYKSSRVAPQDVDMLYSELQLLDLKLD